MKPLLLLIENPRTYTRITRAFSGAPISSQITTLSELRKWLTEHQASTALVSRRFPELDETIVLLSRFGINVTFFEGDFLLAEAWLRENLSVEQNAEQSEHADPEPTRATETPQAGVPSPIAPLRTNLPRGSTTAQPPKALPRGQFGTSWLQSRGSASVHETQAASSRDEVVPAEEKPEPSHAAPLSPTVQIQYIEVPVEKHVYVQETVPLAMRPRVVAVVGLTDGAGASFVSMAMAHLIARKTQDHSVLLLEHPAQEPYLYHRLDVPKYLPENAPTFAGWVDGQILNIEGVDIAALRPSWVPSVDVSEQLVQFLYRQLRRPFTVIDCGNIVDDMVLSLADEVYLVIPCDPVLLARDETAERFREFSELYSPRVIANRWTKHAKITKKVFGNQAVYMPFVPPESTERAAWETRFVTAYQDVIGILSTLEEAMSIPKELRTDVTQSKKPLFGRRKH